MYFPYYSCSMYSSEKKWGIIFSQFLSIHSSDYLFVAFCHYWVSSDLSRVIKIMYCRFQNGTLHRIFPPRTKKAFGIPPPDVYIACVNMSNTTLGDSHVEQAACMFPWKYFWQRKSAYTQEEVFAYISFAVYIYWVGIA